MSFEEAFKDLKEIFSDLEKIRMKINIDRELFCIALLNYVSFTFSNIIRKKRKPKNVI